MTTPVVIPLDHPQMLRITVLTERFDCIDDYTVESTDGADVLVKMGFNKGKVREFRVSPAGSVRVIV